MTEMLVWAWVLDACLLFLLTEEKMLHRKLLVTIPSIKIWDVWVGALFFVGWGFVLVGWVLFGFCFLWVFWLHLVEIFLI